MISEFFNNYFLKIGQTIAENTDSTNNQNFKTYLKNSVSQSIILDPPQPNKIYNIINCLNLHKATGHDIISSYLSRMGKDVFAPYLFHYFELAFELGIISRCLKIAKVIPVYKTGNKQHRNNYRPISLLPSLSKVFKKLIKTRLEKFFKRNKIFYDNRHGFKEKHSVIHALLDAISLSYDAIQNNRFSGLLLMDFRKAFAMVSHDILLQKLCH